MSGKTVNSLVVLILITLSLTILANSMTKPLGRDEQMYCTGGVLMAQGKMIYRDFSYVAQLPYHPLLYATLFKILNTNYYLLVGRLVSVICDILVMLCIFGIYRQVFGKFKICGKLAGAAGAVLYVFNPLVDYANGYAWNHDVVILCVAISFWLYISADSALGGKRYWRIATIGGLLTLATCMRITTALVQMLFFAALLSQPTESIKERFKAALLFLIGTGIVLIWPIWVIVSSERAFFLNLYWIPMLYGKWLQEVGLVHNKLRLILDTFKTPGYFVLIVLTVYLCFMMVWQRRKLAKISGRNLLLAVLIVLVFFIIALIPPTMWEQYLAIPVPFIVISLAYPLLYIRTLIEKISDNKHFKIAAVVVGLCVIITALSYPVGKNPIGKIFVLFYPEGWVPIRVHKISQDIAEKTPEPKKMLTLAPLFALEGGCDIYTELSCGSIVYRIGDRLSAWNRDITHTVGSRTLLELLEKEPPSAVIVNIEMKFLEEHLIKTAVKPDWERKVYENGPVVYFRR